VGELHNLVTRDMMNLKGICRSSHERVAELGIVSGHGYFARGKYNLHERSSFHKLFS
jgi:hypothetical protein